MQFDIDKILNSLFDKNELNHWDPSKKIEDVTRQKEKYLLELTQFISETKYDLVNLEKESQELCEKSDELLSEIMRCKTEAEEDTLPDVSRALTEHTELSRELNTVLYSLDLVNFVVNCGRYIYNYKHFKEQQNLYKAVEYLNHLNKILRCRPKGWNELTITASIEKEYNNAVIELSSDIDNAFNQYIYWSIDEINQIHHIKLHIWFEPDNESYNIINTVNLFHRLEDNICKFANFLLNNILKPIMVQECTFSHDRNEFNFTIQPKRNNIKPDYEHVFKILVEVLSPIAYKLNLHELDSGITLMTLVTKEIGAEFAKALIDDCLLDTIPDNVEDMQHYGEVTEKVELFQQFLEEIVFFPDSCLTIMKYTAQLDELFCERFSQHFLETARTIMYKDLSVTMSIGVEEDSDDKGLELDNAHTEELLKLFDFEISKSLFYFPRCMISKSSQELLDLVFGMMEQAVQSTPDICRKMYVTMRLVFELYDAVVPYHHEEYLQNIPQYVALFHNNCMFIAHNLQLLGDRWTTLMADRELYYPICFVDLVPKLQDLGHHHLAVHLQQQRKQILDNIRASDLNSMNVKDLLSANAEQAIRQCLRQMQILRNVWIGVFPPNVFVRVIATLMSVLVEELVERVCSVEDLSAAMCTQLGEIFSIVLNKAPKCFQKEEHVEEHVDSWPKFRELVVILSASLKEIEARWRDNGPISKCFTVTQLRSLVKAIFQNNQFRANFLAKLK